MGEVVTSSSLFQWVFGVCRLASLMTTNCTYVVRVRGILVLLSHRIYAIPLSAQREREIEREGEGDGEERERRWMKGGREVEGREIERERERERDRLSDFHTILSSCYQ